MPKRRITTPAQKRAAVANLAKARAARRRSGVPKGKKASQVGPLKRQRVIMYRGQLHHATTSFRGTTTIHHPPLTAKAHRNLVMKHSKRVK